MGGGRSVCVYPWIWALPTSRHVTSRRFTSRYVTSRHVAVAVSQGSRVGGARLRWLRERAERPRNPQMGRLSVANRMHGSATGGVVPVIAPAAQCGVARQLSPGFLRAGRPSAALTLWNSLAATR